MLVSTVNAQINENSLVDPLGYPKTPKEYLKVINNFFGGLRVYRNYSEVYTCMNNINVHLD
jgi:hypothetical protein